MQVTVPEVEIECAVDGCDRPSRKAGMCWGHWKRRVRGTAVSGELKEYASNPYDGLTRAALGYADADTGDEHKWWLARERFREALQLYVRKWAAGQLKGQARRVPLVERR